MSQNQEKEIKKFNLFIGDEFSKIISAPSINDIKKSLCSTIDKDFVIINNNLSLPELVQKFLDAVLYDKSEIVEKINKIFTGKTKYDLGFYKEIFENKIFSSIISTNYDCVLEDNFSEYIKKSTPFKISDDESSKMPFYKIFGDYKTVDKFVISTQDLKRLKALSFYKEFWNELKNELQERPTIFLGLNLKDKHLVDLLNFILNNTYSKKTKFYFYSDTETYKIFNNEEHIDNFLKKYSFEIIRGEDAEFLSRINSIFFKEDTKAGDADQNYA